MTVEVDEENLQFVVDEASANIPYIADPEHAEELNEAIIELEEKLNQ